jgi:hypothetical protein
LEVVVGWKLDPDELKTSFEIDNLEYAIRRVQANQ